MKTQENLINSNTFVDGNYSFENEFSFARKNVKDGKVKYNDGTLVDVKDHIKKNHYEKVYFNF
jgi:hypothetical protein